MSYLQYYLGDEILKQCSSYLSHHIKDMNLFRVHGDQFVILSYKKISSIKTIVENITFLKENNIEVRVKLVFDGKITQDDIKELDNEIHI